MTADAQTRPGRAFAAMLAREFALAFRRPGDLATPVAFFVIVCALFPLALSPAREVLLLIGPGVVWVAALLAQLLSTSTLFRSDLDDGSLEQWLTAGQPLTPLVAAKILNYWLVTGVPLVLASPLLGKSYQLPAEALMVLVGSLTLGTLVLALLGAIGAAITLGARQSSTLLSLLILPLAMPVLIFGARAVSLAATGASADGALKLLAALCILAVTLAPFAVSAALRISLD